MKIAFCGTRGIPPNYGGFETAVDKISIEFVKYGYEVDVFCRINGIVEQLPLHDRRRLIYIRGSKDRKFDTFLSSLHTSRYLFLHRREYTHIFWFNNANFPGIVLSKLFGLNVTVNTDGIEWRRKKWSLLFKIYYFISSTIISIICKRLITDSISIQDYYKRTFRKNTFYIPYGSEAIDNTDLDYKAIKILNAGIESDKFFLQITRIEPDNLPLEIAQAFIDSKLVNQGYKYVVIGLKETTTYSKKLNDLSNFNGIIVLPAIYNQKYLSILRKNCVCYIHGNSVGGTNPALLEAMQSCRRILAIDISFSREVLGKEGEYFDLENLPQKMVSIIQKPDQSKYLQNRCLDNYQWKAVALSYMDIVEGCNVDYRSHLQVQDHS